MNSNAVIGWRVFRESTFLMCFACLSAAAQDNQFLPEIDAHVKLNSSFRANFQAKDDREGGDPEQATIGPSVQFYRKPLLKLKKVSLFDLDDTKSRPLVLETGYRVVTAPDAPIENRAIEAVTFHFPLFGGGLLSDRNRADLDWKADRFTWRYRNELMLERTVAIHSYHFIPYVAAEPFYESQYNKWSSTDLYGGCLFPMGKHVEWDVYYEHENDTSKKPNQQNNYVGLALYLYFSLEDNSKSPLLGKSHLPEVRR